MSPFRFALAVPLRGQVITSGANASPIQVVTELTEICGAEPQLWMGPGVSVIELGPAGAIVGLVFARGSADRVEVLPEGAPLGGTPLRIAQWLTRECWGAYVAVLTAPASGRLSVYPDPSGLLPVYRRETASHVVLASEPGLLGAAVSGESLRVAWSELQSFLAWRELRQRSTCLDETSELTPGALYPIGGPGDAIAQVWRPDDFMPTEPTPTFAAAAANLRDVATTTIGAWARQFGRVAVAASGGVDSSLICAALARGGHAFDCVTLATADPSGDERTYVQLLGDHLDVRTISATYDLDQVDLLRPASLGLARPWRKAFLVPLDHALFAAADDLGAGVVLDGNAGDNLFCFLHSAAAVVDRLRVAGAGPSTFATFVDLCRLTGCDIATMGRAVLRRLTRPPRSGLWPPDLRLLADGPLSEPMPLHGWFETEIGRHSGKRDHLALIMRAQNFNNDIGSLPRFSPLVSQPLLEFCLGIPTWLWSRGGVNRALARAAFAANLPREIVERTSKAGPDSFIRKLFVAHRDALREELLDGLLVSHRLLDRSAVEAAFSVDAMTGDSIVYRLLDLTEAEAWARSWSG